MKITPSHAVAWMKSEHALKSTLMSRGKGALCFRILASTPVER